MKNFKSITSALLLATTLTSTIGFAGNEGGGGDAVKVQDNLVMRDFLGQSPIEFITDNVAFLKSIPDFNELIKEIAKVDGAIAHDILAQLLGAKIYQSRYVLPVLPSAHTTISGPEAEIQIAVRAGDDIILAPEFEKITTQSYLLVHEALHGLMRDSAGPMHHHRVRSMVNYLKTNRGNYKKMELVRVFLENSYNFHEVALTELAFDENLPNEIRCHALRKYSTDAYSSIMLNTKSRASLENYNELKCLKGGSYEFNDPNMEKYLSTKINLPAIDFSKNGFGSVINFRGIDAKFPSLKEIAVINLAHTNVFQSKEKRSQHSLCSANQYQMTETKDALKNYYPQKMIAQGLLDLLASNSITEAEKTMVKDYFSQVERPLKNELEKFSKIVIHDYERLEKSIETTQENQVKCAEKFKDLQ